MTDETISCEVCGGQVAIVRSVMLRGDHAKEWERFTAAFPDPNDIPKDRQEEFNRAYLQYQRNSVYRRAFVCLECYNKLNGGDGWAEIITSNGPKHFNMSGSSRERKAAVYNYAKWLQHQERKAGEMGIEM